MTIFKYIQEKCGQEMIKLPRKVKKLLVKETKINPSSFWDRISRQILEK